ncbi:hypothetical protein Vwe01_54030 [Micromonospora andamanensis]|nr:hypothetical protein Vwe01_54030 [Micromonospora andamanensis]
MGDQFRGRRVRPPLALAVRLPSVAGPSGGVVPGRCLRSVITPSPRRLRLAGYAAAAIMAERQGWRRTDRTASGGEGAIRPARRRGGGGLCWPRHTSAWSAGPYRYRNRDGCGRPDFRYAW